MVVSLFALWKPDVCPPTIYSRTVQSSGGGFKYILFPFIAYDNSICCSLHPPVVLGAGVVAELGVSIRTCQRDIATDAPEILTVGL